MTMVVINENNNMQDSKPVDYKYFNVRFKNSFLYM